MIRLPAAARRRHGDVTIAVAAAGLLLAAGIRIGMDVARINAIAAEPTAPVRVATKAQAWECVARLDGWWPKARVADLRIPGVASAPSAPQR